MEPLSINALLLSYKMAAKKALGSSIIDRRRHDIELARIGREIERWIGDGVMTFSGSSAIDLSDNRGADGEDWALRRLCESLVARGGLVPVSKALVFFLIHSVDPHLIIGNDLNRVLSFKILLQSVFGAL